MLEAPLAPYLLWAKTRLPAAIDLAGSNLLHCSIDDLPGARDALDVTAPNDNGYRPIQDALGQMYGVAAGRVVHASGCSGANFIVVAALVGAGDEVLIERPTYDPLIGACQLMGATVTRFERRFETGYALDCDEIASRVTPRTRLIVVTTPHNPSGAIIDRASLEGLGRLAARAGATVLVDEVYLDGARLAGTAGDAVRAADLGEPFVSTSSLTKSYGLAGLRCGWAVASAALAERFHRTRDVVDNAGSAPGDRLAALAFAQLDRLAARTREILTGNIAIARRFFAEHPALELATPPQSSVVFPRLRGVDDSEPFVRRLVTELGVAVAPGRFFDAPAHFRISLAGKADALERGLRRIAEGLREWM